MFAHHQTRKQMDLFPSTVEIVSNELLDEMNVQEISPRNFDSDIRSFLQSRTKAISWFQFAAIRYLNFPYMVGKIDDSPGNDILKIIRFQIHQRLGELIQVIDRKNSPMTGKHLYDLVRSHLDCLKNFEPVIHQITKESLNERDPEIKTMLEIGLSDYQVPKLLFLNYGKAPDPWENFHSVEMRSVKVDENTLLVALLDKLGIVAHLRNQLQYQDASGELLPITTNTSRLSKVIAAFTELPFEKIRTVFKDNPQGFTKAALTKVDEVLSELKVSVLPPPKKLEKSSQQ